MIALDNLVKTGGLNAEPPDKTEFDGLLAAATTKLVDVGIPGLSQDSQFLLAYGAAHGLSLAALRWHGYRCDKRYLVFQCLMHTLELDYAKIRILDKCHSCRNLAEYEGHLEFDDQLLKELIAIANELLKLVKRLNHVM